ncbi:MAG TPA: insulinase family protein [Prolixibacteraceae bacterium]|nr:insulinase family protein [Prolixibacteraceae bacterium]
MKKFFPLILIAAFVAMMGMSCTKEPQFKVNETYHGFKLVEKRFVKEVNADCYYFIHEQSGARLLKIAAADPNKMFNVAFKTLPDNDYGTPHILEHSVLNGSKNFPVKSPFDILMKGSLNTFLNAMTGSDITTYPVASMNLKDYFNLMHVYLDAVYNPLLLSDPRILRQEGWHYELESKESPLVYKGVVYNEMKGAYSSPEQELDYQVSRSLFPENTYGVSSGGHPNEIPKLTYDYFKGFYKKYYHPSNSYIMLYGDADLAAELQFIHGKYLSAYQKAEMNLSTPLQKPFSEVKVLEKTYPAQEGSPLKDNTLLSLSIAAGQSTDRTLCMALDILSSALVNHESAPIRLALQKAGIGKDVSASFSEGFQNVFTITVKNANPEDLLKFRDIVVTELGKVTREGLDSTMMEGILNRLEFNMREGNTPQKGLMYLTMNYQGWFFADDPFLGLEFEKPLSEVKTGIKTKLLENTIQKHLIDNQHAVLISLKPEPGLQKALDAKVAKELADYKKSLSPEQIDLLIQETKELVEHQKKEDSPEALATIPMLHLSDIPANAQFYTVEKKDIGDIRLFHYNEFSNKILYQKLYFDLGILPVDKIPYAALLSSILGKMNTPGHTFGEIDNLLNINTGGFYSQVGTFLVDRSEANLLPKLIVSSKTTTAKAGKMSDLIGEILLKSNYNDTARLKEVLKRHQSELDSRIKQDGMGYAMTRARSYYSNCGMFKELTSGLDYYNFVTDLLNNFGSKQKEIMANLSETAQLLFNRDHMIAAVTCSPEDLPVYQKELEKMGSAMPAGAGTPQNWNFDLTNKKEALVSASKVQYVVKGYDFKKLGYEWNGKIHVLSQIVSTDWLQNQVRVIGGAYGGFCDFTPSGYTFFASYRDPNLKETLQNFDSTTVYLGKFNADSAAMTRYIIGTISNLDQPGTPSVRGEIAMKYYLEKTTEDMLNTERKAVLSTTAEDIRGMKKMAGDILKQNEFCVYGSEAKINENKSLFDKVIQIGK